MFFDGLEPVINIGGINHIEFRHGINRIAKLSFIFLVYAIESPDICDSDMPKSEG